MDWIPIRTMVWTESAPLPTLTEPALCLTTVQRSLVPLEDSHLSFVPLPLMGLGFRHYSWMKPERNANHGLMGLAGQSKLMSQTTLVPWPLEPVTHTIAWTIE